MAISDHNRTTRQAMRIVTSDPSTNRIEGVGQDQAVVQIAMHTKQTITRWPVEGEIWMVERRNGTPYLDALMTPAEEESFSINDMEPGQARINADSVVDQDGKPFIVLSGDLIDQYYVQYDENRGFVLSGSGSVSDAPMIADIASGTSSYTFSGLDGDTDGIYELEFGLLLSAASRVALRFNGDTGSNYRSVMGRDYVQSATTGSGAAHDTPSASGLDKIDLMSNMGVGTPTYATGKYTLYVQSGSVRLVTGTGYAYQTDWNGPSNGGGAWATTTGNVNSITILPVSGTFGGTIILRKKRAPSTVVSGPRIVRGSVNSAGTIVRGSGYTVTKNGTGDYTINFTTPFAATPVVNLTSQSWAAILRPDLTPYSASQIRLQCFNTTTGAAIDGGFDFEAIDTSSAGVAAWSAPQRVTSLPASQPDGTEVYLQPDPSGQPGVLWHMRYDATAAKWDFVGGADLLNQTATNNTITATSAAALPTATVSVTIPVAGEYEIITSASGDAPSPIGSGQMFITPVGGGLAASQSNGVMWRSDNWNTGQRTVRQTLTTGTLALQAWTVNGTGRIFACSLGIRPIRIG